MVGVMRILTLALGAFLVAACGGDGGGGGGTGMGTTPVGGMCSETEECVPESICYRETCVGEGTLRFSMSWTTDTDIDLHVITPSTAEIYFGNLMADAGTLDVDDCVGAVCRTPGAEHVENIVFTSEAMRGEYTFWAVNYDQAMDTEVVIEGFVEGEPTSFTETVPIAEPAEGVRHTLTY